MGKGFWISRPTVRQTKTEQEKIIDRAAKEGSLHKYCWYGAGWSGSRDFTMASEKREVLIVPAVLWPGQGGYREQAELSRLLAEIMCKKVSRTIRVDNNFVGDVIPALVDYYFLDEKGYQWIEWEVKTVDEICPHCGMITVKAI